jgi:Tfp pilus assembly pilus retraction ATPase PilT
MRINAMLKELKNENVSDLFLCEGKVPRVRRLSQIESFAGESLRREDFLGFFEQTLPPGTWQRLQEELDLDLGISLSPGERFRLNLAFGQGCISLVARKIPSGALNFVSWLPARPAPASPPQWPLCCTVSTAVVRHM